MFPSIKFYGGVGSVTGANFVLDIGKSKLMIDCGMIQGEHLAEKENAKPFLYDVTSIDSLIVTHAHLDHVGRIPKLVRDGYQGPIYSTPETRELAEIVLSDAAGILALEASQRGEDPIYTADDVKAVFPLWKVVPYHQETKIADDVSVFLKDAGHILGSAMVEVAITSDPSDRPIKVLFTGDLGNSPSPLLRDTETAEDVDFIIMESVYGDRNHETREQRFGHFTEVINNTIEKGGTLVIPAFSVDRTQTLLYELNNLVEQNKISSVPVFVDSPMAIKTTHIYKNSTELFNDNIRNQISKGDDIFDFPKLQFTISQNESRDIEHLKGAKIILAGSGMSMGGRVLSHEEEYLPDPKNTVLLVGYQTVGSTGRQLADGAKKIHIRGREIKVRARIETLYGYSAHRDSDHLVEFVSTAGDHLEKVFTVMGEFKSSMHLAQRINDELGVRAEVPKIGEGYELS